MRLRRYVVVVVAPGIARVRVVGPFWTRTRARSTCLWVQRESAGAARVATIRTERLTDLLDDPPWPAG